jgi:integrase
MYFNKHIFFRNGYFYYRMAIPYDLKHIFPFREIKQSLNTRDRKNAEYAALGIESKVQQAFSILRSNMFSEETLPQIINSIIPRITQKASNHLRLSELIERYITHNEKSWVPKTRMEVICECKLLIDIIGDKSITSITRSMMLSLRDTLEKLPANIYKKYPKMSFSQIITLPDIIPMSIVSVNKHTARIGTILRYAAREGYVFKNVAEAINIPIKKSIDEERSAYSDEDLSAILALVTNSISNLNPERKWIPLIGMFSGMRQDEICQFYVEDIQCIDNIWCFNVNDEKDKKLKNLASRRIVPIHPFLLDQGLLAYIEQVNAEEQERVWSNLTFSKINGYSNLFGKWYQRFNRQHVTQDKRKVFHSLRHSFANNLKQEGVSESLIAELMGHKNHSITMGRYGKRYEPLKLLDALKSLRFDKLACNSNKP